MKRLGLYCLSLLFLVAFSACNPSSLIPQNASTPIIEIPPRYIPSEDAPLSRSWMSDHFILRADLPSDLADQLILDLESFRYSLLEIHGIEPRDVDPPLEIIFTKNQRDFLGFASGESSAAFYSLSVLGRKIIVDSDQFLFDYEGLWDILFHEYVHHFNASYLPYATPIWLNEGAAEYYSTFRNTEADLFEYGHVKSGYLSLLVARPQDWPEMNAFLNELINYPIINGFYGEAAQKRQAYFYALSWLLYHWFENTDEGQTAFLNMKQALDQGTKVSAAFPEDMNSVLLDYATSLVRTPKTLVSNFDRTDIASMTFSELSEEEYAARLYAQLAFDPGSSLKAETLVALRQVFKEDESLKAYDLLSHSLLSIELGRFGDAKQFILDAEKTAPQDINLVRLSAVIHSAIVSSSEFIRYRRHQERAALDVMGRYAELNPGDIDIDFRVLGLKSRFVQSLGKNRSAAFDRVRKYEHHKRNPLQALYMVYPLMDEQAFDEAELILDRADLWNENKLFSKTILDMRTDLKYNRLAAADAAQ